MIVPVLLFVVAPASMAGNRLDLHVDMAATQCEISDTGSVLHTVYVFLTGDTPAMGVQFAARLPACWQGAVWLGDTFPGPRAVFGNSQTGLQVSLFEPGHGECKSPPVYVCGMLFMASGGASSCCELRVEDSSSLVYLDCTFGEPPLEEDRHQSGADLSLYAAGGDGSVFVGARQGVVSRLERPASAGTGAVPDRIEHEEHSSDPAGIRSG